MVLERSFPVVFLLLLASWAFQLHANDATESTDHLWVGMKLFPTMVSGDTQLEKKRGVDGKLLLLVVYQNNSILATTVVTRLSRMADKINEYPIRVEVTNGLDLRAWISVPVAGIFLAEPLSESQRQQVIQFGIAHHLVTFSSFVDDVKDGVLAGIHVSGKIRPALNLTTLKASEIQYNKFILNIAKIYD
ncbi:putative YfiR family protein [Gammaproteobacteria bacterium]